MLIQIILIFIIGVIVMRLIGQWRAQALTTQQFFLWLGVWFVAVMVIAAPDITSYLALQVGITRGVDLVVYTSIILLFYVVFKLLMRQERQEKYITTLVQKVALDAVKKTDAKE